jgi:ABC-type multidrug transport system fused ATPase/permease subunit
MGLANSVGQTKVVARSEAAGAFEPSVELKNVSFGYPGRLQPAIANVSLKILAGESLAVTGPTGAGKSTLVDLILGVTTPDSGQIDIAGERPANAVALWPGKISYVPQEIFILNRSVRENVTPGIEPNTVDDRLVWRALERAHIAGFVKDELGGLDAILGEEGSQLSGGQRQRIGIARALYSEPGLLVLDEATSALDTETEKAITETVRELHGEVTMIIVAHRLSTVRNATSVIFLEDGVVTARGTFDEVRKNSPRFNSQAELAGM